MSNQEKRIKKIKSKIKKNILIFNFQFLIFNLLSLLPAGAAREQPVLSIIQSQENAQQWAGITKRLDAAGVKYCVIPLHSVRSMADWGDRSVLFMPNVESLSPAQAIALEEWMSKGGRLIASGPVGSLSAPGVRQLLRTLLGGYWGFSLNQPQQLQASKVKTQSWANQKTLLGSVQGGVVVPDDISGEVAATWNAKDNPAAVVATERSTFFGWRWGVDTVAPPELDNAWLRASVQRHLKKSAITPTKIAGASSTCSTSVAIVSTPKPTPIPRTPGTFSVPVTTATRTQVRTNTLPRSDEAIDQLEQSVRLDIKPDSGTPISSREAFTLQQELQSLIGRVESANLTARVISGTTRTARKSTQLASTRPGTVLVGSEQVIAQAKAFLKTFPQLVSQKQYKQARQQWIRTRADLWQQFPLDSKLAHPEIRSIWLDRGTIVRAGSEQRLAQIFDRLAQSGINTVFFETVNASYTIYPSKVAPKQNPLIRGWDPLASAVKLAHERGMELHAWVWVFAAGNRRHNELLGIDPNYPGPVLAANPSWAGYDNRGQMIPVGQGKPFFDPANPQVRQYLLNLYEEIVTRYNVDGLHLDYIRYPFQDPSANRTYGYGIVARQQFQQMTGIDPMKITPRQPDLWQKWTDFRTQQVNSFVAQVSQEMRQKRRDLILSVAVFPLLERERIQKIQQNWEVWARNGNVDLIVPMTYALDTTRFERLAQPWIASTQLGSTLLVPGMRLLNLSTVGAFDQIQLVRDLPAAGYALFAAENLSNDLQKVFNNTQGSIARSSSEPIPHRQPFQTAAIRYTALQQEWKFLEEGQSNSSTFNQQAEVLETALNQLAQEPSASKFVAAKASLRRFQSQFRGMMGLVAVKNPYQVKVWENRLATIERLLRYGERVQLRE